MAATFKVGMSVGAGRWPNRAEHPNVWDKPVAGRILDFCDIRAWANSIHFPTDNPHPGEVMGTALRLKEQGLLEGLAPVWWDHGTHHRVTWEKVSALRPYEEDLSLWRACKEQRLDELQHPRRRRRRTLGEFLPEGMQHLALQQMLPLQYRY